MPEFQIYQFFFLFLKTFPSDFPASFAAEVPADCSQETSLRADKLFKTDQTLAADIFAGRFPADPKFLGNQLPTKVLPGNLNPWENPHESCFLRNFGRTPQENIDF
ncbi:hypothetical protein MtrunA17_Chr7g0224421 [Medicago truncatula]|uniref:Uncharacterized protein n=1 Tax=Medicago truncatula TaxID=3880 RepID=A0A072TXQ4_MEDTR|nr:hypothetical protein MTR_7g027275 [Medicago truncatula]RHN44902.1 hypothetical protein MtrunA17_Chr7g0224421 [Medicago truncatula]